jgi:hypothetical protein
VRAGLARAFPGAAEPVPVIGYKGRITPAATADVLGDRRSPPDAMTEPGFHPQFDLLLDATHSLGLEAARAIRAGVREQRRRRRPRRGGTLRPGPGTPLWNALVRAVHGQFTGRRGEKVALGRFLGLPRQRIHDMLRGRSQMADAERTLMLLAWLHDQRRAPLARKTGAAGHHPPAGPACVT